MLFTAFGCMPTRDRRRCFRLNCRWNRLPHYPLRDRLRPPRPSEERSELKYQLYWTAPSGKQSRVSAYQLRELARRAGTKQEYNGDQLPKIILSVERKHGVCRPEDYP